MLLLDGVGASVVQFLHLLTIGGLERTKNTDVVGLEFMRGMRGQATENNVVLEAKLQYFQGLVGGETVIDEDARFAIGSGMGLRIEDFLEPIQADLAVYVPRFRHSKMLVWGRVCDPAAAMCGSRPYDEWGKRSTISRDAFYSGNQVTFDTDAAAATHVFSAYEHLLRSKHAELDPSLIHVVHVFYTNGWMS